MMATPFFFFIFHTKDLGHKPTDAMLAYKYIINTYTHKQSNNSRSASYYRTPNATRTRHHEITEPNQIILATKATLSFLCRHKHSHRFQIQTVSCTHTSTGTQKTHTDVWTKIFFATLYSPIPTRTYHITIPTLLCIYCVLPFRSSCASPFRPHFCHFSTKTFKRNVRTHTFFFCYIAYRATWSCYVLCRQAAFIEVGIYLCILCI